VQRDGEGLHNLEEESRGEEEENGGGVPLSARGYKRLRPDTPARDKPVSPARDTGP
jgi:hypothetical protein